MMYQEHLPLPEASKTNLKNGTFSFKTILTIVALLVVSGMLLSLPQNAWIIKFIIVCILPILTLVVLWAIQSGEKNCTLCELGLSFASGLLLTFAFIIVYTGKEIFDHESAKNVFNAYLTNVSHMSTQYLLFALFEEVIKIILCKTVYYSPTNASSVHFKVLAFSCGTLWFDFLMIYRRQKIPTIFLCEITHSFCVATICSYFHSIIHKEKDYFIAITILLCPLRLIFVGFRLCSMWGGYKIEAIFQLCAVLAFYAVLPTFSSGYTSIFNTIDYKKNN